MPPMLIISVTDQCNFSCAGCYRKAQGAKSQAELTTAELNGVLEQAQEMGISLVLFAGGEPLLRKDLFSVIGGFPSIIFPVFTNGSLIDKEKIEWFSAHPNVVPVISLEGGMPETDARRGEGVFNTLMDKFSALRARKVLFGASITATAGNFDSVTSDTFIAAMTLAGCRLFFFVEYVPIEPGTDDLVLRPEQRAKLRALMTDLDAKHNGTFISFPGDEERYGGCLAAGRGFIHINAAGGIEPCPFAPFSDITLRTATLREALSSPLMKTIREEHHRLKETSGGCALWSHRDWVATLIK